MLGLQQAAKRDEYWVCGKPPSGMNAAFIQENFMPRQPALQSCLKPTLVLSVSVSANARRSCAAPVIDNALYQNAFFLRHHNLLSVEGNFLVLDFEHCNTRLLMASTAPSTMAPHLRPKYIVE